MILGIDYSMTSPSLCFCDGDFSLKNCSVHYLSNKVKYQLKIGNIRGDVYPAHENMARFDAVSEWAMHWVRYYSPEHVYIEDYAFGATTGRVFHIAENTGLLKYKLWLSGYEYTTISPTTIKKFATGRGNADKSDMEVAFIEQTGYNIKEVLGVPAKQWNPSSDIIDSFYICKYGFYNGKKDKEGS